MRVSNFSSFQFAMILTTVLVAGGISAQPYGGYPNGGHVSSPSGYTVSPYPQSVYVANREMMPKTSTSAITSSQTNPLKATTAPTPKFPVASNEEIDNQTEMIQDKPEKKSKPSFFSFSSIFGSSKKGDKTTTDSAKSKEALKNIDDGQDTIDELTKEYNYSEPDYINSATRSVGTTAKDHYKQGLQSEMMGDFPGAIQHYNAFIAANKKQTMDGTLAAPYHRLALIAWKQNEFQNAEIYFRYAMKYAMSGNVPIIAGDYALFLMERNEFSQAEVILRNALSSYPNNNRLLYYLGRCTARQGKPMESLRFFTTALGEDRAYLELALIYRRQGEQEMAMTIETKRMDYLARQNSIAPQQYFASHSLNQNSRNAPQAVPVDPPPVMANPHGMISRSTTESTIPYPALNNSEGQRKQVYMNTPVIVKPQGAPVTPPLKTMEPPRPSLPQEIPVAQWQSKPIVAPQENVFAQWQTHSVTNQQNKPENVAVQWQTTAPTPPQINNNLVQWQENDLSQWEAKTTQPQQLQGNIQTVSNDDRQPMDSVNSSPAAPVPASKVSKPVSKVFYYPTDEATPVYLEF